MVSTFTPNIQWEEPARGDDVVDVVASHRIALAPLHAHRDSDRTRDNARAR